MLVNESKKASQRCEGVSKFLVEMKCELCDQKATVFYSQLIDGQMKKVCLCNSCAVDKGVTDPDAFSMVDMIMDKGIQHAAIDSADSNSESCDYCGFTLTDFKKVGRLGCDRCYDVFQIEVDGMLENMHRGIKHVGKVPEGLVDVMEKRQKLSSLKEDLAVAIEVENYEEAAGLRDQISQMEESISNMTGD